MRRRQNGAVFIVAHKKPKSSFVPDPKKLPKAKEAHPPNALPAWRMRKIDLGGPWCWKTMDRATFERVQARLANFESMTWREILGDDSHLIAVDRIIKPAQERLTELHLDDLDEVLSLRITGKERVFGYRLDGVVYLLWWDAKHEICPSTKKHT